MNSPGRPVRPERLVEIVRRLLVQVVELLPQRAVLAARAGALLVLDRRSPKRWPRASTASVKFSCSVSRTKRDDVARLAAAEALVEALVRVHVEGGGLLVVEGAQALEARLPGLAQGHDARHHVGDVDAQLQVADAGGFDDGHGTYAAPAASGTGKECTFNRCRGTVKFGGLTPRNFVPRADDYPFHRMRLSAPSFRWPRPCRRPAGAVSGQEAFHPSAGHAAPPPRARSGRRRLADFDEPDYDRAVETLFSAYERADPPADRARAEEARRPQDLHRLRPGAGDPGAAREGRDRRAGAARVPAQEHLPGRA